MSVGLVVVSIGLNSKYVKTENNNNAISPKAIVALDFGLKVNTVKNTNPKNDKYEMMLFAITNEPLIKVQPV